jgi:hypothetical protein
MTSPTTLLWRDAAPCNAEGLRGWQRYTRQPGAEFFAPHGESGQVGPLARAALGDALRRNTNVLIGWQPEDPATTPAAETEAAVRRLWPCTTICRERSTGDRWVVVSFGGEPAFFSASSIERMVADFAVTTFPLWQPGAQFRPHAVAMLHDVTAEDLGLVPPHEMSPDDVYAAVSDDPAVIEAGRRWDRATPSTHRDLVAAVLAAQARAGVPVADRAPLSSGAVDDYLTPLLFRLGRGDEPDAIAQMRRHTRRLYGEFAEIVMLFMLRTYRHRDTSALLAFATRKEAA